MTYRAWIAALAAPDGDGTAGPEPLPAAELPALGGSAPGGSMLVGGNPGRAAHFGALLAAMAFAFSQAQAQKGTGEATGLAGPVTHAEIAGTVTGTKTGRCAMTTGRAMVGSHVILDSPDHGTVNLHLGPATAVRGLVDALRPGTRVTADAFRTERLPANAYVAQTVTVAGTTYALRDAALRPAWRMRPEGAGGERRTRTPIPMPRGAACPW
mgnify:CR=1 FL=1